MFSSHLRFCEINVPKNLKQSVCSISSPLITVGFMIVVFLRKSTIISFVLDALRRRLLLSHHSTSSFTYVLYQDSSPFVIKPATVVSSANLHIFTLSDVEAQSFVNREYKRGERTHPWGAPVFSTRTSESMPLNFTIWGRSSKKFKSQ